MGNVGTYTDTPMFLSLSCVLPLLVTEGAEKGMVMDFAHISQIVRPMIDQYFDHKFLNETLLSETTTAEWIAEWIYRHLHQEIPKLYSVTLYETATSSATYTRACHQLDEFVDRGR